jgi:hypothetical protein
MAATTEKSGAEQSALKKTYKILKPIHYYGRLIGEREIAEGIELELDDAQAEMLRKEGCIE